MQNRASFQQQQIFPGRIQSRWQRNCLNEFKHAHMHRTQRGSSCVVYLFTLFTCMEWIRSLIITRRPFPRWFRLSYDKGRSSIETMTVSCKPDSEVVAYGFNTVKFIQHKDPIDLCFREISINVWGRLYIFDSKRIQFYPLDICWSRLCSQILQQCHPHLLHPYSVIRWWTDKAACYGSLPLECCPEFLWLRELFSNSSIAWVGHSIRNDNDGSICPSRLVWHQHLMSHTKAYTNRMPVKSQEKAKSQPVNVIGIV